MPLTETNVYKLSAAKQTAKGSPAASPTKRFKMVAGTLTTNPELGAENYSDGSPWGDSTDWFNTLLGEGAPGIEGGSDELAYLLWLDHGAETVSPAGTNEVQTLTLTGVPTGGTITINYDGRPTTPLAFNAAAAAIQAALEALPNIGVGNVLCAGGPWPAAVTVTFQGALAKRPHPNIAITTNALTGGTAPTMTTVDTTPGVNALHTFVAQDGLGFWTTWWSTVGLTDVWRQKYNDARVGGWTIEASTGTKALRITPNLLVLDPGETFDVDPVLAMPTSPVLLYTEGAATFKVNDVVMRGQSQFQITANKALQPVYGDDVVPWDVGRGTPALSLAVTIAADADARAHFNREMYGTATPAAGTKPIKRVPPLGSYAFTLTKKDSALNTIASFDALFPGVRWTIPPSPGPSPDSGVAEVALAGGIRRLGTLDLYTLKVGNQSAAYTV